MLYFLTGEIQTGKTRWLQRAIDELAAAGVKSEGLISPGVWREETDAETGRTSYVKEGITSVLLPDGDSFPFAIPREAARANGTYDDDSQSARSGLDWFVDEEAIARVNAHFDKLDARLAPSPLFIAPSHGRAGAAFTGGDKRLLVIDELGQMELMRSMGIMSAVRIVDRGATERYPHAVVVVRKSLLDTASSYFVHTKWGGMVPLYPTDEGIQTLKHAFHVD